MEIIKDKEQTLVLILKEGDSPEGLKFHTQDSDFIQVATWNYNKGKKSSVHAHNLVERVANKTQEVIHIKSGKVKLAVYAEDDEFLKDVVLTAGDTAIIFAGGHGIEVLEDNTQALEIKNGPYPGMEKDKREVKNERQ